MAHAVVEHHGRRLDNRRRSGRPVGVPGSDLLDRVGAVVPLGPGAGQVPFGHHPQWGLFEEDARHVGAGHGGRHGAQRGGLGTVTTSPRSSSPSVADTP